MQRLQYFSGMKPTLEDLQFEQTGKESAVLDRQREMFSDGVVTGLELVTIGGAYTLLPGVAYLSGERVCLTTSIEIPTPDERPVYLFVRHQTYSFHTVSHFATGEEHQIFQSDSFETVWKSSPSPTAGELMLAEITDEGILDRRNFLRLAVDDRLHIPNTDIGTTSHEFRVGIGDPQHPYGLRVLTESPVPPPPLNLRITAIRADLGSVGEAQHQQLNLSRQARRSSGYAQVQFAWGFQNLVGESVAAETFRLDSAEYQFERDALKGYYLTFASGEEYYIVGNSLSEGGATLITVTGNLHGLSGYQQPAVIHPGATEYRFTAFPVMVSDNTTIITDPLQSAPALATLPVVVEERVEGFTRHSASPVASNCSMRLRLGQHYVFQAQTVRGTAVSPPRTLGAGSYRWQGRDIAYGCPFLVALPSLGAGSLRLTALPNGAGFTAELRGWEEADLLEYGWALESGDEVTTIDFESPAHHPGLTDSVSIRVVVADDLLEQLATPAYTQLLNLSGGLDTSARLSPQRRRYRFAARPLIGGQVVGETVSARITLSSDSYAGQSAMVTAIQALTRNLDLLNKSVRNLDAIRSAQAARVEDQLLTLNSAVQEGQQYSHFSVAEINLPFPEVQGDIPLLGRDSPEGSLTYELDPEATEQVFSHGLGHLNYLVQVRDADGVLVDADIDLNENDVVIRLSQPMAGSVLILDGQTFQ